MGLIAIGDIHGCARTLDRLLARLAPTDEDHLVFIGDYIDRGPDSKGVIDRLLALAERVECTFLRGNHEALMLGYLDANEFDLWRMNGGVATLRSYANEARQIEIPPAHLAFIRTTELAAIRRSDVRFVHAGLLPSLTVADNLRCSGEDVFLWERGHLDAEVLAWEKPVVCGHTPRPEPINRDKLIDIDTGCVYHMHPQMGHLTAVRLPEREFVMVEYEG